MIDYLFVLSHYCETWFLQINYLRLFVVFASTRFLSIFVSLNINELVDRSVALTNEHNILWWNSHRFHAKSGLKAHAHFSR